MVVIAIIGILAALTISLTASSRQRAADAAIKNNVHSVMVAVEAISIASNPQQQSSGMINQFIPKAGAVTAPEPPPGDPYGVLSNTMADAVWIDGTFDLISLNTTDPGYIVMQILLNHNLLHPPTLLGSKAGVYYYASWGGNIISTTTAPALRAVNAAAIGKLNAKVKPDNNATFNGGSLVKGKATLPGNNTTQYFVVTDN
jgi:type II secretory pathway pseudopilin PulG